MITIAGLVWDNWFSYGEGNFLNTEESKVTQITGINGSGKSSIPVIIGEVLYGKNNLGKAKSKLFNRYLGKKNLFANLVFYVEDEKYTITYERKSTLKLTLYKGEADISSHTATETYKTIQSILGYDFNTFWGLIYQSSKDGLEFLTATDTTRKKFLVNLFNLEEYVIIHDFFKKEASRKNTELLVNKGKLEVVNSWIKTNEQIDLTEMPLLPIPNINKKDIDELSTLKSRLANIHEMNKKINYNEQLKSILNDLDTSILSEDIDIPPGWEKLNIRLQENNKRINELDLLAKTTTDKINKITKLDTQCPTCLQAIDSLFKNKYIGNKDEELSDYLAEIILIENDNENIKSKLLAIVNARKKLAQKEKVQNELTDLLSKIDKTLPENTEVESDINNLINTLTNKLSNIDKEIADINSKNLIAEAHNSKIKVVKQQLIEYKLEKESILEKVVADEDLITQLNIIKKAFSTNGLISYKIENLSKELEEQINLYLAELSKGRFQLKFTILGEKLNIDIIDDGNTIGVEELSAGELARVNTATLLAIRKLMAAISSNKINILFLDEITGVLDEEGKEVLIDILSNETELNTFLVSHEFTHPLIPRVDIIKENKISRIEE